MTDYIKRSDVLNSVEEIKKSPWYNDDYGFGTRQARHDGVSVVVDLCIKDAPAADVKEVVHAKWIYKDFRGDGEGILCCSECLGTEGARKNAKFCSECGAKMDLEMEWNN